MNDPGVMNPYAQPEALRDRATGVRWRILVLLMISAGLFHFNRISISAAGTEHIMQENNISETQMGMVYSSYLFVYTLCMLPGGWVIDRFGPRVGLMIVGFGSCLLAPLTGATGMTPWSSATELLVALCIIRGIMGMISAPFHPSAARAVSFWIEPQTRALANGLVTGSAVLGIAATPFVFGFLMDVLLWPRAFMVAGFVTLIVASVWSFYATDHPFLHRSVNEAERTLIRSAAVTHSLAHESGEESIDSYPPPNNTANDLIALLANRSLVVLTLSYAAYSYCQYLSFYWLQYYFDKILHLGKDDGRLYATITNLSMAFGMISGGHVADYMQSRLGGWLGRAITPFCGLTASSIFLLLGLASDDVNVIVACFAISMATLGACEASFWVTAIDLGGRRGGLSGAFLNTIGNASGILAPLATPIISEFFGWKAALALASLFCLIGAALWYWIVPPARPKTSD